MTFSPDPLTVVPGRVRILGLDYEPLSPWKDNLFHITPTLYGFDVIPLQHVAWLMPKGTSRAIAYQYQSEGWDTTAEFRGRDRTVPIPRCDFMLYLHPPDWAVKVLEDYVLGYSPAL